MAIQMKKSKLYISFPIVVFVLWTAWFATARHAEAAAVLTGTPTEVIWGGAQNPAGQSITIPSDATAVYMFWAWWSSSTGLGLASATLNGASPNQTIEAVTNTNPTGSGANGVAIWYRPATGSQTLDLAWDGVPGDGPTSIVVYVKDGNTTSWRDAAVDHDELSNAVSATVNTVSGDLVLKYDDRFETNEVVPTLTPGWTNGQTAGQLDHGSRLSYISATGATQVANSEDESYSSITAVSIPAADPVGRPLRLFKGFILKILPGGKIIINKE